MGLKLLCPCPATLHAVGLSERHYCIGLSTNIEHTIQPCLLQVGGSFGIERGLAKEQPEGVQKNGKKAKTLQRQSGSALNGQT